MQNAIHPEYSATSFSCACGNAFSVGSTSKEDIRVEICAQCHPLYTGKSNLIDTAGRLDKFKARQEKASALQGMKKKKEVVETPAEETAQ